MSQLNGTFQNGTQWFLFPRLPNENYSMDCNTNIVATRGLPLQCTVAIANSIASPISPAKGRADIFGFYHSLWFIALNVVLPIFLPSLWWSHRTQMMTIVILMMIASYTNDDNCYHDDRIVHKWWWSSSWWWSQRTQMMMIVLIMMIASYTNDDIRCM